MPLTRKEHWATRHFNDFLLERAHTPFKWGGHDCALFAADGIRAMTSVDIAEDFRGKYNGSRAVFKAIHAVTGVEGGTVEHAIVHCTKQHSMEEWKYPLMAQRGDLVLLEDAGRMIAGLVHLNGREVVAPGEVGLKRHSIMAVRRAWKVG